jgi:hypothetical protein
VRRTDFFAFYEISGHNNRLNLFLPDHPPEISDRGEFGSLGGDISFRMTQTVYVIRVYVIVRSHAVHFLKDYSRVIILKMKLRFCLYLVICISRPRNLFLTYRAKNCRQGRTISMLKDFATKVYIFYATKNLYLIITNK